MPTPTSIPEIKIQLYSETIEKVAVGTPIHRVAGKGYKDPEPKLVIVASQQDAITLTEWISAHARETILRTDFENDFVLVAFHGRGTDYDDIQVGTVWQLNGDIIVKVFFQSPRGFPGFGETTSPYHAVKVDKKALYQKGDLTFVMVAYSGAELARTTHFIP